MSKAAIGAKVLYCGHQGYFVADIFAFNGVNVVIANGAVTPDSIIRGDLKAATHRLSDFPAAGYWGYRRGVFVVPESQVTELKPSRKKRRS